MIPATPDEWVFVVCMVAVGWLAGFLGGRPHYRPAWAVGLSVALFVLALYAVGAHRGA